MKSEEIIEVEIALAKIKESHAFLLKLACTLIHRSGGRVAIDDAEFPLISPDTKIISYRNGYRTVFEITDQPNQQKE